MLSKGHYCASYFFSSWHTCEETIHHIFWRRRRCCTNQVSFFSMLFELVT